LTDIRNEFEQFGLIISMRLPSLGTSFDISKRIDIEEDLFFVKNFGYTIGYLYFSKNSSSCGL